MQGAHWEAGEPREPTGTDTTTHLRPLRRRAGRRAPRPGAPPRRAPHPRRVLHRGPPAGVGEGRRKVAVGGSSPRSIAGVFRPEPHCYPSRASIPGGRFGQVRNRRWLSALRHGRAGGQQERRAADPRGVAADRGGGGGRQRPAHPRRRGDARAARGPRRDASTGATTTRSSLRASSITSADVDAELAERIRASFLLAGPLLARFGEAHMPPPGGDVIGRRRLDPHLDAFRALGAQVHVDRTYEMWAPARPARLRLLHGRADRDGHRERADGGRAHAGHHR